MRVVSARGVFDWFGGYLALNSIDCAVPHRIRNGDGTRGVTPTYQLAVGKPDVAWRNAGERRVRVEVGQTQQLVADRLRRLSNPVRHGGGNPRSAFDGRLRESRIAEFDADVVKRETQHIGGDLRHDRVGAGADVGGRAGNLGGAVGGKGGAQRE